MAYLLGAGKHCPRAGDYTGQLAIMTYELYSYNQSFERLGTL